MRRILRRSGRGLPGSGACRWRISWAAPPPAAASWGHRLCLRGPQVSDQKLSQCRLAQSGCVTACTIEASYESPGCARTYDVGARKVRLDRLVEDGPEVDVEDVVRGQRQRRRALVDGEDAVRTGALRQESPGQVLSLNPNPCIITSRSAQPAAAWLLSALDRDAAAFTRYRGTEQDPGNPPLGQGRTTSRGCQNFLVPKWSVARA